MVPNFIFNGIDSSNFLILTTLPSVFKAEKDIQMIEIVGRDGFVTQDNGAYKSIIKSVTCTLRDLTQIDYICSWLTGSGDVTFSNEPDKIYKATIITQIEFTEILKQFHSFIIQFTCQPHKYSLTNELITLTTSPSTIVNTGTVPSNPVINVIGNGAISLNINGSFINLTNIAVNVIIDSEIMDCYKGSQLMNSYMNGDFPQLIPGNNVISWTGSVTSIEITPNYRYL